MATQSAHLTDEQLSAARLQIDDPLATPRLSTAKPSAELTPSIVGEYHFSDEHPKLWCCHCQGHRHRNGFVITNETGSHHMLGSKCGPDHYGLSFTLAKQDHKAKVQRKGVLERLHAICEIADLVLAAIQEVARSEGLRLVDQKREELRRASDSAFKALANSVRSSSPLHEVVQVRDLDAERRRDEQLPDDKVGPPIYRDERMPIGRVAGVAIVRDRDDCRDCILSLKAAIIAVQKLRRDDTNKHKVQALLKAVRTAEEAWESAQASIVEAEGAPAFFSPENLDRLERWTAGNRYFRLMRDGRNLRVNERDMQERLIERMPSISLPRLPAIKGRAA